ncbi:hypothetical protein MANES_02G222900v8 [Manihot esculenta]|nr:hypothetical protein MANES_02G222900v8 [Manihot esculenta]KAG8661305.1 hypothetical protein MANES_02G222900v8 [Manihot esculenta]KAG8661306.1 hypothetical protein MANES_02G222900v8 [Manihot esculenta]OAY58993.1 hypothetical protein MANES_02G222900v8 [Manihot esculenta]OAY58994.1 hypothetical protein MANES_02G222900v8 [Manihot esculenta]
MVKRKSCFYHLAGSLPIKYAFQGLKGTWLLHVEVQPSNEGDKPDLSHCLAAKNGTHFSDGSNINDSFVPNTEKNNTHNYSNERIKGITSIKPLTEELWKTAHHFNKKRKKKKNTIHLEHKVDVTEKECPIIIKETPESADNGSVQMSKNKIKPVLGSSSPLVQTPIERSPKVLSERDVLDNEGNSSELNSLSRFYDPQNCAVASIANESGVEKQLKGGRNGNCSNIQAYSFPRFATRTPSRTRPSLLPADSSPGRSGSKLEKTAAVGKRILIAAKSLRASGNKQRPVISFQRFRGASNFPFVSRIPVFEISDNDD